MVGTVDPSTWVKDIGIPGTIAISLVIIVIRMIQAYIADRKTQSDREKREDEREAERAKRDDERQAQQFKFIQTQVEQNTLLRDTLEKQNDRFMKAIEANTAALTANVSSFADALVSWQTKALASHGAIIRDVNEHTDATLNGVEVRLGTKVDDGQKNVTGGLRNVADDLVELNRRVATKSEVKELAGAVEGIRIDNSAERATHKTARDDLAEEFRKLSEKIDGLPQQFAEMIQPTMLQLAKVADQLLAVVPPPVIEPAPDASADALQTVAPALAAVTTKRATGTLSAVAADVAAPDAHAKRDTEAT